jgi:hypothetical protein
LTRYQFERWDQGSTASDLICLNRTGSDYLAYLVLVFEHEAAKIGIDIVVVPRGIVEAWVESGQLMMFAFEEKKMHRGEE